MWWILTRIDRYFIQKSFVQRSLRKFQLLYQNSFIWVLEIPLHSSSETNCIMHINIIKQDIRIEYRYILSIAGQMAGPIGLTFCGHWVVSPVLKAKNSKFFSNIFFFCHEQCWTLELVSDENYVWVPIKIHLSKTLFCSVYFDLLEIVMFRGPLCTWSCSRAWLSLVSFSVNSSFLRYISSLSFINWTIFRSDSS